MDISDLDADPLRQLAAWMEDARSAGEPMPEAMTIATAIANGTPAARVVISAETLHAIASDVSAETSPLLRRGIRGSQWTAFFAGAASSALDRQGRHAAVSVAGFVVEEQLDPQCAHHPNVQ